MQVNPTTAPLCAFNETDLGQEVLALLKLYQGADRSQQELIILALEASVHQDTAPLEALLQSKTLNEKEQQAIQGLINFIQRSNTEVQV